MALAVTSADGGHHGAALGGVLALYGAMAVAALAWLWARDRLEALPLAAIGQHGPWLASALGLGAGWLAAACLAFVAARVEPLRAHEALLRGALGRLGEGASIALVLAVAIGEELFFRLAVQDCFGLAGSVAFYVLLHIGIGGLWWVPVTLLHALALGLIVQQGFGLLGSATANAILNHLSLRRIRCT
jgi:hypothetical protein